MDIKDALGRYLVQIKADGRSEHTAGQYRRHITLLATWLEGRNHSGDVESINHESIAEFLTSPTARRRPDGRSKQATSTNALRTSLRTYFRFVHDAGYCQSNPARLVRRAMCGAPPPRAMSDAEQARLLLALSKGTDTVASRDHALFFLMLTSGIRLGSALALEVGDVDLERGELALRKTKGDVPTLIPIARALRDHLRGYIDARTTGPLFRGRSGRVLSARHAQRRLAIWCRNAGIERPVRPHDLRHSYAIALYRRTKDLLLVQAALRHRSIDSTTVYARLDQEELRRVIGC